MRFDGWKLLTDIYSMYSLHPKYRKLADFFSAIDQAILRRAATWRLGKTVNEPR